MFSGYEYESVIKYPSFFKTLVMFFNVCMKSLIDFMYGNTLLAEIISKLLSG